MSEKDDDSVKEKWEGGQGGTRRNQKKAERLHRKKEQLKLTALDNRTHFKTGWEVKETEKERKKTYAVNVSDGESYINEEYLDRLPECERMEIEWRKTQRRISESYVFVAKDEIVRYRQPHRKLRPVDHPRERGPLVRLDAPVPHFSTDAIPDSGVRKELDLICLEDDLYLAAIDFDIQGVQNRHFLSLGPSAAKWVGEYCAKKRHAKKSLTYTTERYPDGGIDCDLASTSTDLFGRSRVYYPDADNYKGAEKEFRSRIQYFATNELSSRLLNLRETTSNFMCSISAGLKPTIHMRDDEYNFSRVFCIPIVDRAGLVNGLKNSFPSFLGVREITARERAYARWKSEELGIAKCLLDMGGAAFEVAFGSSHEGLSFCQRYCSKTDVFKVIMKYPTGLDNCTKTDFFSLVLKWHPYASKMRVDVYLKKPEDLGFAEQILSGHGIPCRIPEIVKYTPGNRRMEIRWEKGFNNMAYDSVISERVLRDVLGANGIELDRIVLHRRKRPPLDDHHIMDLIDQRIGRAAVNAKVWTDDYVPTVDMEWFAYIHNKAQLGWMVELPPDETTEDQGRDYERKAIVTFHDEDYGRAVAEYLQAWSADSRVLTLAECDEQGVRFYPIHTVRFECPKALRAVCNDALNAIDDLDREQSDYASRRWVRLRDYKHEDILVVEGWPKDHADQTVEKVRAVLRGRVVSCADDGTDSSPTRLLYGCGLQHVNNLQKTHEEKVIMALDRLNEEITMWGDEDTMDIIRVELDSYVKNRTAYMVNASIIIDTPRFLPIFSEILVFNTNKRIGEAVGGATTRFRYPNRLEFSGSVQQYEDLQQLLDNTHAKALEVVRNIGHSGDVSQLFLTDCPVCLLPAVGPYILELCGHRYCLQCIAEMIRVNVRNRQLPIKCCAEACGEVIALGDILGLLFDENSIGYPQLFMERLQPIFTSCSERGAFDRKNMKFCARLGCSTIIRLMGGIESYDCPRCEMQMCAGCWNPPHAGRSCADELHLRGSAELSVNEWSAGQEGRVKRCPTANCRAVILKEEGCNHMQCSMCKAHFCWLCSFTADIDKEIYAHMVAIHGGTGGGYDFLDHLGEPDAFDAPPGFEHMEPVEW